MIDINSLVAGAIYFFPGAAFSSTVFKFKHEVNPAPAAKFPLNSRYPGQSVCINKRGWVHLH